MLYTKHKKCRQLNYNILHLGKFSIFSEHRQLISIYLYISLLVNYTYLTGDRWN